MTLYITPIIHALDATVSSLRLLKFSDELTAEQQDLIEQAEDRVDEAVSALRKAANIRDKLQA